MLPFAVLFFVLGLVMGSFGTVLLVRLPRGESILGRSHCRGCAKMLRALELIPVISYCLQRGRCRGCGTRISSQYFLIEVTSGILFLVALFSGGGLFPALLLALSLWLFFLCAVIDAQISLLPDALTFPLIATAFLYAVASPPFAIFAPLIGAGFFSLQWIVSRGRAVGSGDILIGAAMGFLLLDWRLMLVALGISYILGASVAVVLLMKNTKKRGDHLPFVPYLAAGTLLTLLFGYQVLGLLGW